MVNTKPASRTAIVSQKVITYIHTYIRIIVHFYRLINLIIFLVADCRCGKERPDDNRNFNRILGGREVQKVELCKTDMQASVNGV